MQYYGFNILEYVDFNTDRFYFYSSPDKYTWSVIRRGSSVFFSIQ